MSVVLSMITKDSHRLGEIFTKVLESTLQVPYNPIILVDDSTTEDTRKIVKDFADKHGKELIIAGSRDIKNLRPGYYFERPTRAVARQVAIELFMQNFSNEWLMFVDDDAVLNPGWWDWVDKHAVLYDGKVGEAWGINWDADPFRKSFLESVSIDYTEYLTQKFQVRGGTHDTLYRRKAIDGVVIPWELHVYEDAWLHHWVRCHGWESVINPVGVTHYSPFRTDLKTQKKQLELAIYVAFRYGIVEYEISREMHALSIIKQTLGLFRPIIGTPLFAVASVRTYGFAKGFSYALRRQYLKLWFRWQVLRNTIKYGRVPDICDVLHNLEQGASAQAR